MSWGALEGHADVRAQLQQSLHRGRLSHAYLLVGPRGIGKRLFARNVAQSLLCERVGDDDLDFCGQCAACLQVAAGTHPDVETVELPAGRKFLPISALVGEENERGKSGLCYRLALKPVRGHRKVAIIDDADRMNQESANALLKTLEEPPNSAVILMIASDAAGLLPTIRSRCQMLRMQPLAPDEVQRVLVQVSPEVSEQERGEAADLAEGSVATALELLDPELRQLRQVARQACTATRDFHSVKVAESLLSEIDRISKDSAASRQAAGWLIRFLVEQFRTDLRRVFEAAAGDDSLAELAARNQRSDRLVAIVDRCLRAQQQLDGSMPVPLCVEGLCDDLRHLIEGRVIV